MGGRRKPNGHGRKREYCDYFKGDVINSIKAEGAVNASQIDFSVAIQKVQSDVDGNVGLYYECQSGEDFFFEYNSVLHFLRIRKLVNDVAVTENIVPYVMDPGEWYDCKVLLLDSKIEFYVNNTLMLTQTENYGTVFQKWDLPCTRIQYNLVFTKLHILRV